jgi:hypothetical protein
MSMHPPERQAPALHPRHPPRRVLRLMFSPRIAGPALKVALVVGTMLNVINNGQQFWAHHTVNLWQAVLNFVVPFCVSSYSAARNEARRPRGD